jgi:prepilin-type N-terminal cleavage/methylation domain-containing protein
MKNDHVLSSSNYLERSAFVSGKRQVTTPAVSRARRPGEKGQHGFTLIELLIVICIMSILTVIAVGAYAGVQRQARIDFAADTLIASLREESLLAKSGRTVVAADQAAAAAVDGSSGDSTPAGKLQCFALRIKMGKDGGLWSASTDYIGIPKVGPGEPAYTGPIDTCRVISDENLWQKRDIFDGDIVIKSITPGSSTSVDSGSSASLSSNSGGIEQVYYFKPPFGQLYLQNAGVLEAQRDGIFDYLVGVVDQPAFDRKVQYDVSTGEAKKVK